MSSTTTFRAAACPSYWTLFLFHFTIPSIPDAWRIWLGSQEHSSPTIYAVLLTVHRSLKAIYGFVAWLVRFRSAAVHSRNSSELSRALQDGLKGQISNAHAQKIYRDEDDSSEETRALLASASNQDEHHGLQDVEDGALSSLAVSRVSWIINHSKQLQTTALAIPSEGSDPKELAEAIVAIKRINPIFCPTLVECLRRIQAASRARAAIEERSKTGYKPELHRGKLKELLTLLRPRLDYDNLPPKGWQEIGFQGADPSTDLRGAGLLGLDALLVFARYYGSSGQEIVAQAVDGGSSWYPWALASINITWWCVTLIKARQLEYFLVARAGDPGGAARAGDAGLLLRDIPQELHGFLVLQAQLSLLFHRFWCARQPPPGVMDFEALFKRFARQAKQGLDRGFVGGVGIGWVLDPPAPDFAHQQLLVNF